jgi:hypothetical protein
MTAKTVVDVILGEAKAGSYQDMLAIASVISNRATGGRTSFQDVVSRTSEFNAYGKPLPSGVNQYRSMAEKAIEQVKTTGPIHNATFYATPKAQGNLPKGLEKVTATDGHIYFTDPQQRPIYTASGLKKIDYQQVNSATPQMLAYNDAGLPGNDAPVPDGLFASVLNDTPKSNGLGLANLVDGNRNKSAVQYANQQATRNQRLSPGLQAVIDQSAAAASEKHGVEITPVISSGGQFSKTDLKSGGFKGGRVGSTRHDHGLAGDMQFKANGKLLDMRNPNDKSILGTIVEESAARGATGIGGAPNYMGTKTLHIGYGKPATWGKSGEPASKFVRDAYARGRERYDPNQTLNVDVPTPQPRYEPSTSAAPRGKVQREELGPASITPAPFGNVTRAGSLPQAKPQEATNPTARKLQAAYQKNNVPTPAPRPADLSKAYTPKASDYSNYMMNVKQPTLPTGSAIPTPAARPADLMPAPVIDGPVGKPLDLVPTPPTRIQQAKTKATNHLKEQLHPKTLAARGAGALIGGLLGGPLGARAGSMFGPQIAQRLNNKQQGLFGGIFNQSNQAPMQTGAVMGSSSSEWGNAQNKGATYSASDGATITGLGNGTYSRTNPITGKSSQWNEDGSRSTKGY